MRIAPVLVLGLAAVGCGGSSVPQAGEACANVYRSVALETANTQQYAARAAAAAPGSDARQRATSLHDASDALVRQLIAKNARCFRQR